MERAHYRRVASQGGAPAHTDGGPRERLIAQGIVSALALAAVLFTRFSDAEWSARVISTVSAALTEQSGAESLISGIQERLGLSQNGETAAASENDIPLPPQAAEESGAPDTAAEQRAAEGYYIDEEMITEFNAPAAGFDLKPTVPEPPAVPEP